jgi:hypothetical protein
VTWAKESLFRTCSHKVAHLKTNAQDATTELPVGALRLEEKAVLRCNSSERQRHTASHTGTPDPYHLLVAEAVHCTALMAGSLICLNELYVN